MKLFEIMTPTSAFSLTTTDLPMYDEMIELPDYFREQKGVKFKIYKNFPPSNYIDKCAKANNMTREELLANRNEDKIKQYAKEMLSGTKFPLPMLDYSHGFTQEGLHRAFAAEIAGLKTMPFMVVDKV